METKTNVHTALNSAQTIWTVMVYKTNLKLGFVVVHCWIVCVWLVGVLFCNNWIYIYTFRKKTSRHTENCISFHVEVYSNSYYYMSEIPNKKMQFWHNAPVENQKDYCIFVLAFKWKFLCAICPSHSQ